jgi:hypothetical protein
MDKSNIYLDPDNDPEVAAIIAEKSRIRMRSENARLHVLHTKTYWDERGRKTSTDVAFEAIVIAEEDALGRAKKAFFNTLDGEFHSEKAEALWQEFLIEFTRRGDGDTVYAE